MTIWEIVLLIAGFACVCLSFFVARGRDDIQPDDQEAQGATNVWTEKEEQIIRDRVTQLVEERQSELLDAAQDQMNHLCNEKIMAVDEFSSQLLEKIENNHQEVVFMYNMLNEKEKEVRKIMTEPVVKEVKTEKPKSQKTKPAEPKAKETQKKPAAVKPKEVSQTPPAPAPAVKPVAKPAVKQKETASVKNVPGNVNLKIQKMYREGKSILEISKALDIGQGEVQLVIALYGGRRR